MYIYTYIIMNTKDINDKHSIQDYELNLETKPFSIIMSNGDTDEPKEDTEQTVEELLVKLEIEGKKAKEEHELKLKEKIDNINNEIKLKNTEDNQRRDKITRIRIISLSNLKVHPMTHTMDLPDRMRKEMIKECDKIMTEMTDDEITKKFNEIVCEDILNNKSDYTKYPIYN